MIAAIIDKPLRRERLRRAAGRSPGGDFLLRAVVDELAERLAGVDRMFAVAVASGGQTDALADAVLASGKAGVVVRLADTAQSLQGSRHPGAVGDPETLPFQAESLDLYASALDLQWANDLPGALIQIRRALRPDGLFLAALTGGDTLRELREALFAAEAEIRGGASPRVVPAVELRDIGALLQRAGFALPVVDRDVLTVRYDSVFGLFADLKAMGATNVLMDRDRRPAGRRFVQRIAEIYAERFSDADGRVRATFEIIHLSGWAPHESQQQPARRGSAQISLAAVLKPSGNDT